MHTYVHGYRRGRLISTSPTYLPTSTTWPRRRPSTSPRASTSPTPWDTIEARIKSEVTYNGELTTPEPHITTSGGGSGNQSVQICVSVCLTTSSSTHRISKSWTLGDRHIATRLYGFTTFSTKSTKGKKRERPPAGALRPSPAVPLACDPFGYRCIYTKTGPQVVKALLSHMQPTDHA